MPAMRPKSYTAALPNTRLAVIVAGANPWCSPVRVTQSGEGQGKIMVKSTAGKGSVITGIGRVRHLGCMASITFVTASTDDDGSEIITEGPTITIQKLSAHDIGRAFQRIEDPACLKGCSKH